MEIFDSGKSNDSAPETAIVSAREVSVQGARCYDYMKRQCTFTLLHDHTRPQVCCSGCASENFLDQAATRECREANRGAPLPAGTRESGGVAIKQPATGRLQIVDKP